MDNLHTSPRFQFLMAQFKKLLIPPNNFMYTKYSLIFAVEFMRVSHAAYRVLKIRNCYTAKTATD